MADLQKLSAQIATLNAPDQGLNYRGPHGGERRYDELTGNPYWTRSAPATLTIYGERADTVMAIIKHCKEIAAALSTPAKHTAADHTVEVTGLREDGAALLLALDRTAIRDRFPDNVKLAIETFRAALNPDPGKGGEG